jgi:hypothetical protein
VAHREHEQCNRSREGNDRFYPQRQAKKRTHGAAREQQYVGIEFTLVLRMERITDYWKTSKASAHVNGWFQSLGDRAAVRDTGGY